MTSDHSVYYKSVKEKGDYRKLSEVFKAVSHPSRLMILDALRGGERSVQEIHELVGSDLSTVSRHLSLMKYAGLVSDERKGKKVIYRLVPQTLDDLAQVIAP
jgi:ArsR family transcriptional regulator